MKTGGGGNQAPSYFITKKRGAARADFCSVIWEGGEGTHSQFIPLRTGPIALQSMAGRPGAEPSVDAPKYWYMSHVATCADLRRVYRYCVLECDPCFCSVCGALEVSACQLPAHFQCKAATVSFPAFSPPQLPVPWIGCYPGVSRLDVGAGTVTSSCPILTGCRRTSVTHLRLT